MRRATAAPLLLAALLGAAQEADDSIGFESTDPVYRAVLPAEYLSKLVEPGHRVFERALGEAEWQRLRLEIRPHDAPLDRDDPPKTVAAFRSIAGIPPPGADAAVSETPWGNLAIPRAEYTTIEEDLEVFTAIGLVPLRARALVVVAQGPAVYRERVAEELETALAGIEGPTNWLTDEERRTLGLLRYPGWIAVGAAALYLLVWALAFRGHPWRAHGLRIGWMVLIGLLFFSAFMLPMTFEALYEKSGEPPPIPSLPFIALPGMLAYVALGLRRIYLYIEG